jgi:sugar lactone lactonase YvrE
MSSTTTMPVSSMMTGIALAVSLWFCPTRTALADILYVTTTANAYGEGTNGIQQITSDGIATLFVSTTAAAGVAVDGAGNFFAASGLLNTIEKISPGGVSTLFAATNFGAPLGLAMDKQGNVFVAGYYSNVVWKFAPDGAGSIFASNNLNNPFGLAFDSAGDLFVSNAGGTNIMKFSPEGVGSVFASLPGPYRVTGLGFDSADNLYAVYSGTIQKYTPSGTRSVFVRAPSGMSTPYGLAVDSAGNVYVCNEGSTTVMRYTQAGVGSVFVDLAPSVPRFVTVVPDPGLQVQVTDTNTVVISWPAPAVGYALKQTQDLGAGSWALVTNMPVLIDSQYQVIVSPSLAQNLYRLQGP